MAQDVTVAGAAYSDVPAVALPATGGGTAEFYDVSATTATAEDVAQGKQFYSASGALTTGTASGGGGASAFYANGTSQSEVNYAPVSDNKIVKGKPYYKYTAGSYTYVEDPSGNPSLSGFYAATRTTTITITIPEWSSRAGNIVNVYMSRSATCPTINKPDTYVSFYLVVNNEQFELMYDGKNISASTNTPFSNIYWDDGDVLTFVYDGSYMQYIGSSLSGRVIRSAYSQSDGSDGNIVLTRISAGGTDLAAQMYGTMYVVYMEKDGAIPSTQSPRLLAFRRNAALGSSIVKPGYISSWQDYPLSWKAGEVLVFSYNSSTTDTVLVSAPSYMAAINTKPATASTLGCVKVGSGLAIDSDGVLSLDISSASGVSF